MNKLHFLMVAIALIIGTTSCEKDDDATNNENNNEPTEQITVIDFEGAAWSEYVAESVGSAYSSDVVTADYIWQEDATTLTSLPITAVWDGISYLSGGFAVSSYNSCELEKFNIFGGYLKDLYVYHPTNKDATKGGGAAGSDNFLVGYGNYEGEDYGAEDDYRPTLSFADGKARTIKSCYVNATTYFVSITELGNDFSPALAEGDKITLYATGYDAEGVETKTIEMVMAEKGNITKSWKKWDLSSLGEVVSVRFNIKGGPTDEWGMMSPKYFALDNIEIVTPL